MKRNLGRRLAVFILILLTGAYLLFPTLFPQWALSEEEVTKEGAPWFKKILPHRIINKGLDLQGGLHLVLGLDVDQVVVDSTELLNRNISDDLKRENITPTKSGRQTEATDKEVARTQLYFQFNTRQEREKAEEYIGQHYGGQIEFVGRTDLGVRIRYRQAQLDYIKKRAVDQSIETIRNRVDEFGVREPSIVRQGEDRIVVQFPGVSDPERLKKLIGQTAKLEFKLVDHSVSAQDLQKWVDEAKASGITFDEAGKTAFSVYLRKLNDFLKPKLPPSREIAFEKQVDRNTKEVKRIPYLLDSVALMTGEHLENAYVSFGSQFNEPEVNMSMTPQGTTILDKVSGENIGKQMAIVLDGNIHSAPVFQSKIPNGQARITMGRGMNPEAVQKEAEDTALVLRAGSLPASLDFQEERTIGPSLGEDSIRQGVNAMVWGVVMVMVFMILWYGIPGVVAVQAVFVNVALLLACLVLFGATLTLPGIAGIVLTVGMAVDGNIIIYERIRDEFRERSTLSVSIDEGFSQALSTILDSNITTLISGIFLYQFGTGPIKGFAVTLSIGILTTVFTNLFVSRLLMDVFMKIVGSHRPGLWGYRASAATAEKVG